MTGDNFHLPPPPLPLRHWLQDRASLTRRLQQLSHHHFSVTVLKQHWEKPRLAEVRALSIPRREVALVREVILYGHGEPWVYARSVLPQQTLHGALRFLRKLDNRPLGALLFSNRHIHRERPFIHRCASSSLPAPLSASLHCTDTPTMLWGRSSVFCHGNSKLLVSETFLPALVDAIMSPS